MTEVNVGPEPKSHYKYCMLLFCFAKCLRQNKIMQVIRAYV